MPSHSFTARIRRLVLFVAAGFGLAVLAAFQALAGRQVAEAADRDVMQVSSMMRSLIRGRGELLDSVTRFGAGTPRIFGLAMTDAETVGDQMPRLRSDFGVDALMVTDRAGRPLGEIGFRMPVPGGSADPLVASALEGEVRKGVVARGGDLMIAASHPLRIGEYVQGTLSSFIRLGEQRAKEIKGEASFELAFLHGDRVTATTRPMPDVRLESRVAAWETRIDGRAYIARYGALPGTTKSEDVGFIVLRPMDEALGPYRQLTITFLLVLGLVSVVAQIAGSIFASRMVRSLEGLVKMALRLKQGEWPERIPVKSLDEVGVLQSAFNDMAESLRSSQDRLLAMIDTDPLTDLDNHRHFKERLHEEAARTTAAGESLALLLIDIDGFSAYNAEFGHAAGDQKLRDVAHTLQTAAPEFATLARYGGEEFAVLLPDATVAEAERLFYRIRDAVGGVTLSGGCAELSEARGKAEDLVVAAELALTRAKELGGGNVSDFGAVPGANDADPVRLARFLNDGTYATIKALAAAVDAKDPYTHGHSDRVAEYAADLARYVGAPATDVDLIHRCGTLHDVGKIGVPDAILQKPGRLEPDELRIMQTHAALGEYIVGKVPQLGDLLPGVRHHHERYDGRGYPDGLRGEEIPRMARFLAIADTYDAMTSDRPYRKGMDSEVAIREIEKMAGSQFDPELAAAFVAMMRGERVAAA